MGGRGASSGISVNGNIYGSQYKTLLKEDNIKFVTKVSRDPETLMETMTNGRIYAQIGGDRVIRVILFDDNNKRNKSLELDKATGEWHSHIGYLHSENGTKEHDDITTADRILLDRILRIWENHKRKG